MGGERDINQAGFFLRVCDCSGSTAKPAPPFSLPPLDAPNSHSLAFPSGAARTTNPILGKCTLVPSTFPPLV